MKLLDLFKAIKEESLTKYQLEGYCKELSELYADMHLQMGVIKKNRAMFMLQNPEMASVAMKRKWEGMEEGQREIELKSYIKATSTQLSSLKNRLYSQY